MTDTCGTCKYLDREYRCVVKRKTDDNNAGTIEVFDSIETTYYCPMIEQYRKEADKRCWIATNMDSK